MSVYCSPFRIAAYQLRKMFSTSRVPVLMMLIAIYILQNLDAVRQFSISVDIPVTPFAFPHIVNDLTCQLVIMAGVAVLFCDAPFEDADYMYMVTRSGRSAWAIGQVLYILLAALAYVLFLWLMSIIPFLDRLDPTASWGKIWGTLVKTDAGSQFGLQFSVTEYLEINYDPVKASVISLLLEWSCASWLGMLIYALNKLSGRAAGTVAGVLLILFSVCAYNDWMAWANLFSPVSLAQLTTYSGYSLKYGVTLHYGTAFYVIGLMILVAACVLSNHFTRRIYGKRQ